MTLDILGGGGGGSGLAADLSNGANGILQSGADTASNLLSGLQGMPNNGGAHADTQASAETDSLAGTSGNVAAGLNGILDGSASAGGQVGYDDGHAGASGQVNYGGDGDDGAAGQASYDSNAHGDAAADAGANAGGNTWKAPPTQHHGDNGANSPAAGGGLTTSASVEAPPCTIQGGPAKVIYFPSNIVPGQDGIGADGLCTTMNTVLDPKSCYFSYSTLWAGYTDGETYKTVGPTYANTMIACPSSEVSTRCAATDGAAVNWDEYSGDSQGSCTDFAPPAAMMTMVPEWGSQPTYSMTYEAPQNPMVPAVPAHPTSAPAPAPATGGPSSPSTTTSPGYGTTTQTVRPYQSSQPATYAGGSRSERRVGWVVPAVGFVLGLATFAVNM